MSDARYITIDPTEPRVAVNTPELTDWLLVDLADDGHVLGIEILGDHSDSEALIAFARWVEVSA